jgi:2-iminobutanoate/2-iminopropanoate deaminase
MKMINSEKAPKAVGPYSQAVKFDKLVFTSGQIAIDPKTNMMVEGNIVAQTTMVLENLKNVLEAAGTSIGQAVKVTVYIKNMNDYSQMNEIYAKYFTGKPARSTVEVARLPKDALVEIDVVAVCE